MEKRGILFLGAAGVIFGCGFLWHWLHLPASTPETHQICLQDGAQRLAFLESQGQPEPYAILIHRAAPARHTCAQSCC